MYVGALFYDWRTALPCIALMVALEALQAWQLRRKNLNALKRQYARKEHVVYFA